MHDKILAIVVHVAISHMYILPYIQVVKNEYSSHAHQQFSFNFGFKNEFVSLNISQKGLELGEWKITPFYNPIVSSSLYMVVVTFCFVFGTASKIQQWCVSL